MEEIDEDNYDLRFCKNCDRRYDGNTSKSDQPLRYCSARCEREATAPYYDVPDFNSNRGFFERRVMRRCED